MEHIGYSVVDINTNQEIAYFGDIPGQCAHDNNSLILPNNIQVFCPVVGETYEGYKYVKRFYIEGVDSSIVYDGQQTIVTRPLPPQLTLSDLQAQLADIQAQINLLANT